MWNDEFQVWSLHRNSFWTTTSFYKQPYIIVWNDSNNTNNKTKKKQQTRNKVNNTNNWWLQQLNPWQQLQMDWRNTLALATRQSIYQLIIKWWSKLNLNRNNHSLNHWHLSATRCSSSPLSDLSSNQSLWKTLSSEKSAFPSSGEEERYFCCASSLCCAATSCSCHCHRHDHHHHHHRQLIISYAPTPTNHYYHSHPKIALLLT